MILKFFSFKIHFFKTSTIFFFLYLLKGSGKLVSESYSCKRKYNFKTVTCDLLIDLKEMKTIKVSIHRVHSSVESIKE